MPDGTAISTEGAVAFVWTVLGFAITVYIIRFFVLRRLRASETTQSTLSNLTLGLGLISVVFEGSFMTWTAITRKYYDDHPSPYIIPALGMPLKQAVIQQKITMAAVFAYYTTIWSVKATFLLYYYEFCQHLSLPIKTFLYVVTGVVAITYVANMILNGAWCIPISRVWDFTSPDFCSPANSRFLIAFGAWTNITTDLLLILFPIFILKTVQFRRRQRWAIGLLLFIGALTVMTAIIRFGLMMRLIGETSPDGVFLFWQQTQLTSGAEQVIGLFGACLPALRALLRKSWNVKDFSLGSSGKGSSGIFKKSKNSKRTGDTDLFQTTQHSEIELTHREMVREVENR